MVYTSRSAIEAYQDCPKYRYNQFIRDGTGYVSKSRSIPLVQGTAVHTGIEHLLSCLRLGTEPDVEHAVILAKAAYEREIVEAGFSGSGVSTDAHQEFTYEEQRALAEGLVRAWHKRELPNIVQRYRVIGVEREVEPIPLSADVMFQARVDAELQEISSGDYHNYSLKTMGRWNERSEMSYRGDLQGITEIWAVEEDSKRAVRAWDELIAASRRVVDSTQFPNKQALNIWEFSIKKKPEARKVMGVRFCFLIKGDRRAVEKGNPESRYETHSPLIRGYKNIGISGVDYAHSMYFPNPGNASGIGRLGKGWEPFNVWEDMGVQKWMEMIDGGEIQPDCGDIIKQQVVTPGEYFRSQVEMDVAIKEIKRQEEWISNCIKHMELSPGSEVTSFPHYRKHCEFHFGGACEYKPMCWMPEVNAFPLGSGLYQIRVPHHRAERMELENGTKSA